MRKLCVGAAVVLAALTAITGTASASQASAQAAGDAFVTPLMPGSDGSPGLCDVKTESGFFANGASYLASCATSDGTIQAFFITGTKKGQSLKTKSPYLGQQLANFCANGHAYGTGVKTKFAAIYAEAGDDGSVAKDFRDLLASKIPKSTPGYIKPFTLC